MYFYIFSILINCQPHFLEHSLQTGSPEATLSITLIVQHNDGPNEITFSISVFSDKQNKLEYSDKLEDKVQDKDGIYITNGLLFFGYCSNGCVNKGNKNMQLSGLLFQHPLPHMLLVIRSQWTYNRVNIFFKNDLL